MFELIQEVDEVINYFNSYRLEQLETRDQNAINKLIEYIDKLETIKNKNIK